MPPSVGLAERAGDPNPPEPRLNYPRQPIAPELAEAAGDVVHALEIQVSGELLERAGPLRVLLHGCAQLGEPDPPAVVTADISAERIPRPTLEGDRLPAQQRLQVDGTPAAVVAVAHDPSPPLTSIRGLGKSNVRNSELIHNL
jgi:hypothetical protein